jgi:hypothetical protein
MVEKLAEIPPARTGRKLPMEVAGGTYWEPYPKVVVMNVHHCLSLFLLAGKPPACKEIADWHTWLCH